MTYALFMFDFIKENKTIFFFFGKLILLGAVMIFIYNTVLNPARIPDRWLTVTISSGVVTGVNTFFPAHLHITADESNYGRFVNIRKNGVVFLRIWDNCNGLDLIAIYLSLIILLPYRWIRKLIFIVAGATALIIANIIRCIALYWIYLYNRKLFDINHHYIFTILIYLLIFYLWLLFTKKGRINEIN